jgi:hypothetical protein
VFESDDEEFGTDGCVNPFMGAFSDEVELLFGKVFRMIGIPKLHSANDLLNTGSNKGGLKATKINLLFVPKPCVNGRPSYMSRANVNLKHPKCWASHMKWYRTRVGGDDHLGCVMELAIQIQQCFSVANERIDHLEAMDTMECIGPVLPNHYLYMALYDEAAQAFLNFMNSNIVHVAAQYNWSPIFILKDGLLQSDRKFGRNGWKLASGNLHEKSFLSLVGFKKQYSMNEFDYAMIGISHKNTILASAKLRTVQIESI